LLSDIRVAAGIAALLFLPGYGVLTLLFSGDRLSSIERLGISFILSLIMILILFLFIENLPVVAGRDTIVVSTTMVGFLLNLFGTYRQYVIKHNKFMLQARSRNNSPSSDLSRGSDGSSTGGGSDGSSTGDDDIMNAAQSSSDQSTADIANTSLNDTDHAINNSNGITSSPPADAKSGKWI
jgi:hypothetical protein